MKETIPYTDDDWQHWKPKGGVVEFKSEFVWCKDQVNVHCKPSTAFEYRIALPGI